jgi:uncharacterized low-complexity protein
MPDRATAKPNVAFATSSIPPETAGKSRGHLVRFFTPGRDTMSNKIIKPLSIAVGVAFVGSLAISQAATASSFSLTDLDSGYPLAGDPAKHDDKAKMEGSCGEGMCGADKDKKEGSCGEGKCGEGKCGEDKKAHEGKCGEGKCGEKK